jgi:hypothetical protein
LTARIEICAVFGTALLFQLFANVLDFKVPFLCVATVAWAIYGVRRMRRERGLLCEWGIWNPAQFGLAVRLAGLALLIGVALLLTWRLVAGWEHLPADSWSVFLLYPVWSFIQEFVVQALLVNNFRQLGMKSGAAIFLGGCLFSLAHFPDFDLMALTLVPGFVWTWIFLRSRNLVPIALCHAWLGTLAFCWILERDPWARILSGV